MRQASSLLLANLWIFAVSATATCTPQLAPRLCSLCWDNAWLPTCCIGWQWREILKHLHVTTLITNKNKRLESSFIPTPYRKQKTSILKRTPFRHYLSTDSNATFLWTMHLGRIAALPSTASQRNLLMWLACWCAWALFFENEGCMSISIFSTKYCPRPKIAPPHKKHSKVLQKLGAKTFFWLMKPPQ